MMPGQDHFSALYFYLYPGIYAEGYIVFVFPFVRLYVRLFVRTSVTFVEFASKFCVNVSQVVYISATSYQKAFIFGPLFPWRVGIDSMTPDPGSMPLGGARGQNLGHL